jgi:8-oxo-dGTP pyrophosphatase MutT (NUDIX family)
MLSPVTASPVHPDLAAFLERAGQRLATQPPDALYEDSVPLHGDHRFSPELLNEFPTVAAKPAAVLITVIDRPHGPTVLLTQRSSALRSHSGQIAFPGGRIDPGDRGPLEAALREAEEEVGLARALIQPIGYLDLYLTGSGYRIAPVVALADPGMVLHLNPDEVAGVFECPLAFLMDPANHVAESREWRGIMRHYYAMPWEGHYIWGVTAGIIHALYERVYG